MEGTIGILYTHLMLPLTSTLHPHPCSHSPPSWCLVWYKKLSHCSALSHIGRQRWGPRINKDRRALCQHAWLLYGSVMPCPKAYPPRRSICLVLWVSFHLRPKGKCVGLLSLGSRDLSFSLKPGSECIQDSYSTLPSTHQQPTGPWSRSPEAKADGRRDKLQNEYMNVCLHVNHRNAFPER